MEESEAVRVLFLVLGVYGLIFAILVVNARKSAKRAETMLSKKNDGDEKTTDGFKRSSKKSTTPDEPATPLALIAMASFGLFVVSFAAWSFHEKLPKAANVYFFLSLPLISAAILYFLVPPKAQPLSYHMFADKRSLCCGVPNTLDVLSNVPFLLVGLASVANTYGPGADKFGSKGEQAAWAAVFFGVALVAVGSAYYHWKPDNARLVWDRLPMTIGFMGIFSLVLEERLGAPLYLFPLLLLLGLWSVWYWDRTDDLRPYFWVQFFPLVSIPLLLVLFPARYTDGHYLGWALGLYGVAKITEVLDKQLFKLTGRLVSGHTLKHLLAAVGLAALAWMLHVRTPI